MKEEDKMDYTAVMEAVKQYEKASWYKDSLEWTAEDDRYLYQQQQQKRARQAILNWTKDRYKPTHFISIQLPTNYRSHDETVSLNLFKRIIKNWERQLCGSHWIHHYIPFITFAENHKGLGCWHYHILFNQGKYSDSDIINAAIKTCRSQRLGLPTVDGVDMKGIKRSSVMDIKKIDYAGYDDAIFYYSTKETSITLDSKMNPDRIIPSNILFGKTEKDEWFGDGK